MLLLLMSPCEMSWECKYARPRAVPHAIFALWCQVLKIEITNVGTYLIPFVLMMYRKVVMGQTPFVHRTNSNICFWTSNWNIWILDLNEQTSNIEPNRPLLNLLDYSSNRRRHHFSNIDRTWTCSSFANRTQTPYFLLLTIENQT